MTWECSNLGSWDPTGKRDLRKQDKGIRVNSMIEDTYWVLALVISHCIFSLLACFTHPNKLDDFTPVNLKA